MSAPLAALLAALAVSHVSGQIIYPLEEEITLTSGASYTLTCDHSSNISWHLPHKTETGSAITISYQEDIGKYQSNLKIVNAHFLDTGLYSCQAEDTPPDEIPSIYLYVRDSENLLAVNVLFGFLQATEGDNLIIPCKPTSLDVNVTLWKDDEPVEGQFNTKQGFILHQVSVSDSGHYKCIAARDFSQQSSIYELHVHQRTTDLPKPNITPVSPMGGSHLVEGGDLVADCNVMVSPSTLVSLNWTLPESVSFSEEGVSMTNSMFKKVLNGMSHKVVQNRLIISQVNKRHEGLYICHVTDHVDNASQESYHLIVDARDMTYLNLTMEGSSEIVVRVGKTIARWIVFVQSNPPAKVVWYTPQDKEIPIASEKYSVQSTPGKTIVEISDLSVEDSGIYRLEGDNGEMKRILNVSLLVEDKPHIKMLKENFYMFGRWHSVTCAIIAYPVPVVEWFSRECSSYPNCSSEWKELKFQEMIMPDGVHISSKVSIKANKTQEIMCVAFNKYGNSSSTVPFLVTDVAGGFALTGKNDVVTSEDVVLKCGASVYSYKEEFYWQSMDHNNISRPLSNTIPGFKIIGGHSSYSYFSELTISNISLDQAGLYSCFATPIYSSSLVSKNIRITVSEKKAPKFTNATNMNGGVLDVKMGDKAVLLCNVSGSPRPDITWLKNGESIRDESVKFTDFNQTLEITYMIETFAGKYECIATNLAGSVRAVKTLRMTGTTSAGVIYLVTGLIVFAIVCAVVVIFLCFRIKRERKKFRDEMSIVGLYNFSEGHTDTLNPELDISEQADLLPYDKKWEFPRDKLKLGRQLGSGAFGVVIKAQAFGMLEDESVPVPVAVKMVKRNSNFLMVKNLASELKILAHLGKNLNVVNLIGACTDNINNRELLVIVEYCKYGNLHNYLQKHRNIFINQLDPTTGCIDPFSRHNNGEVNSVSTGFGYSRSVPQTTAEMTANTSANTMITSLSTPVGDDGYLINKDGEWGGGYYQGDYLPAAVKAISTQDLLCWSYQVAKGMEYLASRKVLHGDLAARNVLLAEGNVVKICDFGLAKNMYKDDNYCKKGTDLLPVKWMSIEALQDRIFSTQSDIWAFGVVLWEFFSLARTPYPGLQFGVNFLKSLVNGYRMEKPEYSPDSIYTLMLECWSTEPMSRPSFSECAERLGNLLEENIREHYTGLNDTYLRFNAGMAAESDYLAMLNDPSFENLMTVKNNDYVPGPEYLNMQRGKPFYSGQDTEDQLELNPMLPKVN